MMSWKEVAAGNDLFGGEPLADPWRVNIAPDFGICVIDGN